MLEHTCESESRVVEVADEQQAPTLDCCTSSSSNSRTTPKRQQDATSNTTRDAAGRPQQHQADMTTIKCGIPLHHQPTTTEPWLREWRKYQHDARITSVPPQVQELMFAWLDQMYWAEASRKRFKYFAMAQDCSWADSIDQQ
jgi:hypothetical protein